MLEETLSADAKAITRLWLAVLLQAIHDTKSNSKKKKDIQIKQEAYNFLFNSKYREDLEEICVKAGINPDYVRSELKTAALRNFIWRLPAGKGWRTQLKEGLR